jgi:hypothetical protein
MMRIVACLLLTCAALLSATACTQQEDASALHLQPMSSPAASGSLAPRMSVDDEGRVILSWLEMREEGGHALRFSRYSGERWSEPRTVSEGANWFANWADTPGVRPVGEWLFAHWLVRSGPGTYHYNIHAAWSDDGGRNWSEPFILHQEGRPAEHGFLSSVVFPEGELGVAWLDGRHTVLKDDAASDAHGHGGDMSLRWARLRPGESVLHRDRELDERVCDCCMTAAVMEPDGPRVFYRDRSAEEIRDIRGIAPEVDEKAERVFADDWQIAACPVNGPAATRLNGGTAVAWYAAPDGDGRVWLAVRDDESGAYSDPLRVNEGRPLGRVSAVAMNGERLRLFWMEQGDEGAVLMGREAGPDALSPAHGLKSMSASRASGFPVAVASDHGVILAWTEAGEEERSVRVARVLSPDEEE